MNFYGRQEGGPRRADALLTALVEEAIAETVTPPVTEPDPVEPVSAEGFLADAAAFLRTRPDAADLLHRLQAMIGITSESPSSAPQPDPEVTPAATVDSSPQSD